MVKYDKIKIHYYSAPAPLEGMYMDRIYTILKKDGNLYITDGNAEIKIVEELLKMLFIPNNKDLTWKDVSFNDEPVLINKYK